MIIDHLDYVHNCISYGICNIKYKLRITRNNVYKMKGKLCIYTGTQNIA